VVAGDVAGVVPAPAPTPEPAAAAWTPAAVAYTPPQVETPGIPYAVPVAEETEVPLWVEKPRQGISMYLFAATALVVLIMAMMALNSMNIVRMPWESDGQTQVKPTASPTPLLVTRTEFARADRFLNFSLSPSVAGLNKTLQPVSVSCNGTLSNSCLSAITTADQELKKVLTVIDHADIPPCIAPGMTKVRADFAQMDEGLQLAIKGFADNNKTGVGQGLARYGAAGPALQADAKAVDQALKTQCSTEQTGP
jgi:hypothetical protein